MQQLNERIYQDIQTELEEDRTVLPSLPDIVLKIWTTIESPTSSSTEIADVISRDPALSARVLRVANSAYYRGGRPVSSLRDAITRLGNQFVKHIVTILEVAQVYNLKKHPLTRPHLARLWQHSTLVGTMSEMVCRTQDHLVPEVAMLAGLTHRIGVLPILTRAERTPALLEDSRVIESLIGNLHGKVGQSILRKWQFPPELVQVPAEHEDLSRETVGLADYVDVVQVAMLASYQSTNHPFAEADWDTVPSTQTLGINLDEASEMLDYAGARAGELRTALAA